MPGSATGRPEPDQDCCCGADDVHDAYEKLDMRETPPRSGGLDETVPGLCDENDAMDEREYLDIAESRLETAELAYCFASANAGVLVRLWLCLWIRLSCSRSPGLASRGCSGCDSARDDPELLLRRGSEGSELRRPRRL